MDTLTLKAAAEYLKMNPEVLRRKAKEGIIPGKQLGPMTSWKFSKEELDLFIKFNGEKISDDKETFNLLDEAITQLYDAKDEDEAISALCEIGKLKNHDAVPYLCELLLNSRSTPAIIVWSMKALVEIMGAQADCYLVNFVDHKDEWVRLEAAIFFAEQLKDENAIAFLTDYYKGTKSFVVLKSLARIFPEKYSKDLIKILNNPDNPHNRLLALRELQHIDFENMDKILAPLFSLNDARITTILIKIAKEKHLVSLLPKLQEVISKDYSKSIKKAAAIAINELL